MRKSLLRSAVAIAALSTTAFVAPSATAAPSPAATKHCVMLVGASAGPTSLSPVKYTYCSTISDADAKSHMNSHRSALGVSPDSADRIMTWYANFGYTGDHTDIYGDSGPCDSAGYRVAPDSYWQNVMSSLKGWGTCNKAKLTTRSGTYAQYFNLPVYYIGNTLNDNVGLTNVYHG